MITDVADTGVVVGGGVGVPVGTSVGVGNGVCVGGGVKVGEAAAGLAAAVGEVVGVGVEAAAEFPDAVAVGLEGAVGGTSPVASGAGVETGESRAGVETGGDVSGTGTASAAPQETASAAATGRARRCLNCTGDSPGGQLPTSHSHAPAAIYTKRIIPATGNRGDESDVKSMFPGPSGRAIIPPINSQACCVCLTPFQVRYFSIN